ncbi:MAG: histidine kinase [uncultured bacterium]|nr:MAG: histidine kinase [uncultured bacterium]
MKFKQIRLEQLRKTLMDEMKLPDFKGRHLFIAKLRLIIFILCWVLFVVFYPQIWKDIPLAPLIFNIGFLMTAICYWFILKEKFIISLVVLEVLADIISQTAIVYMLGANNGSIFVLYGMYVIASGSFFGYLMALLSATTAMIAYCALILTLQSGIIDIYDKPPVISFLFQPSGSGFIFNLVMLPVSFGVIVYGAKIAHYFSKIKEKALETRNVQLLALNRIGATIRKALNLNTVIDQVLKGVIQGLGFDICFLALLSRNQDRILFYMPEGNPFTYRMNEYLGQSLADLHLPVEARDNSAYQSILKNRVIIRSDMVELTRGLVPRIPEEITQKAQAQLGFKKFVITPLVAERRVVGALIGASRKSYVEDSVVDTLDNFANQAALAIESAQLFEELNRKNIELQEANKIKSEFLAIMSHELRTPLTAIIGYSEILLENVLGELNREQKDSLSEVLKNAENLLHLINSILDLAKVEAGKMELALEVFSLGDVIVEVGQTLAPLIAKKNQDLIFEVPEDLPPIHADPRKLRQVLLNLAGNAIKFTPEKGEIKISASYYKDGASLAREFGAALHEVRGRGFFKISVIDTGIGIKAEDLKKIFNIFQQVDSTFTRKYQGTGLGLALSRQLIELHCGFIGVESVFGKGSTFKFLLPEIPS